MLRIHVLMMVACMAVGAGCATSPYSGEQISDGTIQFSGFVDEPGATIRVSARDKQTGAFYAVASITSNTTPTFAEGAICPNSPALYAYSEPVWLQWSVLWRAVTGGYEAKVRARKLGVGEQDIRFSVNPNGMNCMIANAFTSNCDFYNVAYNVCGYNLTEATVKTTSSHPWL